MPGIKATRRARDSSIPARTTKKSLMHHSVKSGYKSIKSDKRLLAGSTKKQKQTEVKQKVIYLTN